MAPSFRRTANRQRWTMASGTSDLAVERGSDLGAEVGEMGECPLCKMYEGREYNVATLAAFEEADRMLEDPAAGKRYKDMGEMMAELFPNVHR
jgi:hypothetical protein